MAVAASILTAAYHLIRDAVPYKELGPLYLLRLDHSGQPSDLRNAFEISVTKSKSKRLQLRSRTAVSW